jgi:hypothetical protein
MVNELEMPQKRHKTGFRGPSPDVGKKTQFKPGNRANPDGRPKSKTITAAYLAKLEELAAGDHTIAELLAEAQIKKALKGDTTAVREITDRTEGKARQLNEMAGQVDVKVFLIDRSTRPPRPAIDIPTLKAEDPLATANRAVNRASLPR